MCVYECVYIYIYIHIDDGRVVLVGSGVRIIYILCFLLCVLSFFKYVYICFVVMAE